MKAPGSERDEVEGWEAWKPVSTIMRTNVPKISENCTADALQSIFKGLAVETALVVDAEGKPIGLVRRDHLDAHVPRSAHDAMEPFPFVLHESIPLSLAAAIMASAGVNEVPIVSGSQDAVGLLRAIDVMAWVARQAGHRVLETHVRVVIKPDATRN